MLFQLLLCIFMILVVFFISRWYMKNDQRRYLNIFNNYFKDKQYNILNLGCGSCCGSKQLEKMGHHVTSLDVVDLGKCCRPIIYDGLNIPFPNQSFDIVICSFVLHHTGNWSHLLKEMKRVAKYIIIIENTPEKTIDDYFIDRKSVV